MERVVPLRTAPRLSDAVRFVAFGILIHLTLLAGAEQLVWRTGHMNPIFRIERAETDLDWVILGASHAMPLSYDGFEAEMEAATGLRLLNLAAPGAGPLYNRFALEHFLERRKACAILYVVDSFAFRSPQWNEERFGDPKLLARTPLRAAVAGRLASYVMREGVDRRVLADYLLGFSRLNDRERFRRDVFEGEAQFDRVFRPSSTAEHRRADYLYPAVADERGARERYLATLGALVAAARMKGSTVVLARFPLPARFAALLPDEAGFDFRLRRFAADHALGLLDFSRVLEGAEYYADTDHLNRAGVRALFDRNLQPVLERQRCAQPFVEG